MAEAQPGADGQPNGEMQFSDDLLSSLTPNRPDGPTDDDLSLDPDADEVVLADGGEEDKTESGEAPDAAPGTMRATEFAKAAGWKLEEFYSAVTVPIDGQDVPLGQALNEAKTLKEAHDALSRERDELHEKLSKTSVPMPQGYQQVAPEAQEMLGQIHQYQTQLAELDKTNWEGWEPGQAAATQIRTVRTIEDLRQRAQAVQAKYQGELQSQMVQAREEADRQTRSRIKPWADPAVMARDKQAIKDMGSRYGYEPHDIDAIADPRVWQILHDLQKAGAEIKQVRDKAKAVRKVGKTLPAGGARGSGDGKATRAEQLRGLKSARTPTERSKIRQSVDLGPLPPISNPR